MCDIFFKIMECHKDLEFDGSHIWSEKLKLKFLIYLKGSSITDVILIKNVCVFVPRC